MNPQASSKGETVRRRRVRAGAVTAIAALTGALLSATMISAAETGQPGQATSPAPTATEPEAAPATAQVRPTIAANGPTATIAADRLSIGVAVAADGTPDNGTWSADNAPGNDSGPTNGIVRVNDTVTYRVEYAVSSGTADDVTLVLTFPKGMEITQVPGFCQAGSSITPPTAGTPALPLTANSIDELSEQTLVCKRGTVSAGTDSVSITTKVLNVVHQGQALPVVKAEMQAAGGAVVAAPTLPSVTASSRLMWDLSKNSIALRENTGYSYGPIPVACPWNQSIICFESSYSVLLSAPAGGKGAMPAVGDITFTDDLSPAALFPRLTAAQRAEFNQNLDLYGSRIAVGSDPGAAAYSRPGSRIGFNGLTAVNAVRNSGSLRIAASDAGSTHQGQVFSKPGQPTTFVINGADLSLRTYPTQAARPAGTAIPAGTAYAVSHQVHMYTPLAAVLKFGEPAGEERRLLNHNTYTGLSVNGFASSDVQTSAGQPGAGSTTYPGTNWNDYRDVLLQTRPPGAFDKAFTGVPGAPGNTPSGEFLAGFGAASGDGPPGGATYRSGAITVAPTQEVISLLRTVGSDPTNPMPVTNVLCDSWDNTKLHLKALDTRTTDAYPGRGAPALEGQAGVAVRLQQRRHRQHHPVGQRQRPGLGGARDHRAVLADPGRRGCRVHLCQQRPLVRRPEPPRPEQRPRQGGAGRLHRSRPGARAPGEPGPRHGDLPGQRRLHHGRHRDAGRGHRPGPRHHPAELGQP